jgi:Tol biopolymer transport system component
LWWRYDVNGHEVWNASGYGGNDLYIVDDLDLLLLLTHDTSVAEDRDLQVVQGLRVLRRYLLDEKVEGSPDSCAQAGLQANTIRPDGTGQTQVADWPSNTLATSWSPDGSALLVETEQRDLNSEIYTFTPDGTQIDRLTFDFAWDAMPYWSPDGSSIAFMRGEPDDSNLYIMSADGTHETQLTDYEGYEHSPSWSPDGERIAFVWGNQETRSFGSEGELWVVGADGSEATLLLNAGIWQPDWSPGGRYIALGMGVGEVSHIGVLDLVTGLVRDLGRGFAPQWSPDGARLAFISDRDGDWDLYTMDPDGGDVEQLTNDAAFDTAPIWSPDGATIMFQSRADG